MKPAEKNYTACEKELLAIISGVQHFHEYLQAKPFLIRTDSSALKYLNSTRYVQGRLGRWNLLLSGYKYRIKYVKGKENTVADTLSRLALPDSSDDVVDLDEKVGDINEITRISPDCDLTDRSAHVWAISLDPPTSDDYDNDEIDDAETDKRDLLDDTLTSYDVAGLPSSCPDCRVFLDYFCDGVLPSDDASARKVVYQAERFVLQDDIVYHLDLPRRRKRSAGEPISIQLVVPQSLRELLLRFYHENLCHLGGRENV